MNNNIKLVLMMNNFQKEEYRSPRLETSLVEMEQGVAAGSARVLPPNSVGDVKEEWVVGDDDNRTIEW
ncbi:hypothetical protein KRE40_09980 [Elizabethkingia meningoseptica]|uniref:Uncharacterized protein n=2 Tax=Elizabethkingia meningoseptica TaxID=238 RepID=A0A1V3U2C3_ELIME|nr:hypothetical protein [Elizabethkingia meningoseptica]MDX8573877.1 hypothetical protein [Elizabethkingia sp. HX WYD]AQX06410.1 hypothetical protein BBD33_14585 [Elizabethkingia meningoseptica]AQX13941.1 hypothetical protein BBD35_16855 [Elizabethkingia meningoseptica]KUY16543.1 hypothetical protein ATB99_08885 [Elizabethkingia meningoseptica]MBG0515751.1 hypothetical protein [Elizabethkingia meningoseptica]